MLSASYGHIASWLKVLKKALAGVIGDHRPVIDLAADRPFKNRRADEGGVRMRMGGRRAAWLVFDEHASHALAGHVRPPEKKLNLPNHL
jgi:hypothetical protein